MKLGKKFQKVKSRKSMMLLLSIVGIMIILIMVFTNFGKTTKVNNEYERLENQRFLKVNDGENNKSERDVCFDLKEKRYFGNLKAVDLKNAYVSKGWTGEESFNRAVNNQLSIFKNLVLSDEEIIESKYVIERDILPLLDESQFDEQTPTDFERQYLSPRKLRKVRIMYNKEFLPTIIEGYYEGIDDPDWQLLRTISYPFKNKQAFDSELADYIDLIKIIEDEQEAEREIENGE